MESSHSPTRPRRCRMNATDRGAWSSAVRGNLLQYRDGGLNTSHSPKGATCYRRECVGPQARETASQETLREPLPGGKGLHRSSATGAGSLNIERSLLIRGSQVFKIRNSAFSYIWGQVRVWACRGHCFHGHLSHPGPVSCLSTSSASSGSPEACLHLRAVGSHESFSFPSVRRPRPLPRRAGITDDRDILVYRSGGRRSASRKRPPSVLL